MTQLLDRTIHPEERVALFIDGANLYSAAKALAFDIDYRKLLDEFRERARLIRASYYTALVEDQDFSPIRPLVDWLDYNGYTLVTKPAREFTDSAGRRRFKGDMDVEIAVDMLEAAQHLDHIFLFSGDGDFVPAIAALRRRGARISVVSTIKSNPPMAADDLRRAADSFLDLADLIPLIGRPPRDRAAEDRLHPAYEDEDR
ncbi:MAG: NYN domain-containing protein [Hyphomonadaceae bacterium]